MCASVLRLKSKTPPSTFKTSLLIEESGNPGSSSYVRFRIQVPSCYFQKSPADYRALFLIVYPLQLVMSFSLSWALSFIPLPLQLVLSFYLCRALSFTRLAIQLVLSFFLDPISPSSVFTSITRGLHLQVSTLLPQEHHLYLPLLLAEDSRRTLHWLLRDVIPCMPL